MKKSLFFAMLILIPLSAVAQQALCGVSTMCGSDQAAENPVYSINVSGVVSGLSGKGPKTLIVNECDISEKKVRSIAELDSAGRFDVDIPFFYGHTFTINFNRWLFINAYAEPGDSVFVSIDASKSPVEFHLGGDNARLNEEYSHAYYDLSPINNDVTLLPDSAALSVYMPKFKEEVGRIRKIVDRYIEEKSLMPETAELLHLDNIFIPANQAIGFEGKGLDEQIAFFTDPIFDIFNERNHKVMIFPYHLSALMQRNPELVNTVPKSVVRDLMYATLKDAEAPARDEFENTAYYDRLYTDMPERQIDFSKLKAGNIVVIENDMAYNVGDVNPVEWLKERFPNRPVYLDVSATWCGPCRAGILSGEGVRQYFSGSDIVFAVIWLQSNLESLKEFVPGIHNAVHIFIPDNDMSNRIMDILHQRNFPSYYFIDREGEISSENIPHFNDPQLVEFLQSKK